MWFIDARNCSRLSKLRHGFSLADRHAPGRGRNHRMRLNNKTSFASNFLVLIPLGGGEKFVSRKKQRKVSACFVRKVFPPPQLRSPWNWRHNISSHKVCAGRGLSDRRAAGKRQRGRGGQDRRLLRVGKFPSAVVDARQIEFSLILRSLTITSALPFLPFYSF